MVALDGRESVTTKISSGSFTVLPRIGTLNVALVAPVAKVIVLVVGMKSLVPAVPGTVAHRTVTSTIAGFESVSGKLKFLAPMSPSVVLTSAISITGGGSLSIIVTVACV